MKNTKKYDFFLFQKKKKLYFCKKNKELMSNQIKYLDPKNDVTFRKIFGEHPHLLISFLNNILPLPKGEKIVHIEYLDSELLPELPKWKRSIVDVRCIDSQERTLIPLVPCILMKLLSTLRCAPQRTKSHLYKPPVINAGLTATLLKPP